MAQPIYQVDAFASGAFTGNPAAVCVLEHERDPGWMQAVAAEMNLSETAFVRAHGDDWSLRWFTPAVEVSLCGHATLASAHILYETGLLRPDAPARFHTLSGLLTACRDGDAIVLDFPAQPPHRIPPPPGLAAALKAEPEWVGSNGSDLLVELGSEEVVRLLEPDLEALRRVEARGIIVTAVSEDPRCDFVSRFFAPRVGVNEDPVTGSAHTALGPFWAHRLERTTLTGYQASTRGGFVGVRIRGDRVDLRGTALTVLRGELADSASGLLNQE
ncbi:MAG TPA: PhzF family phenazine biosynthesis protein [Longimicrobiales bacterium]|nr:PhzF family phenazine biosynthesis protein [Longimicrobiales bacterium]